MRATSDMLLIRCAFLTIVVVYSPTPVSIVAFLSLRSEEIDTASNGACEIGKTLNPMFLRDEKTFEDSFLMSSLTPGALDSCKSRFSNSPTAITNPLSRISSSLRATSTLAAISPSSYLLMVLLETPSMEARAPREMFFLVRSSFRMPPSIFTYKPPCSA
ncbi:Uncharacterised protein [uncultured archaeon]|nr:Uncharacterised protein [uncultured archaeon]